MALLAQRFQSGDGDPVLKHTKTVEFMHHLYMICEIIHPPSLIYVFCFVNHAHKSWLMPIHLALELPVKCSDQWVFYVVALVRCNPGTREISYNESAQPVLSIPRRRVKHNCIARLSWRHIYEGHDATKTSCGHIGATTSFSDAMHDACLNKGE